MKGIILSGGSATRLFPVTHVVSKQLLPIYDKPMIYYPLSILMLAGIRDILIISTPQDTPLFKHLLGDGSQWGLQFSYAVQDKPRGLADAFLVGEKFLAGQPCTMVLGDNIFYGRDQIQLLKKAIQENRGATIFAYKVTHPQRYGVLEFNKDKKVIGIEEKPAQPKSKYAVTGLYVFDQNVVDMAKKLKPSVRGEIEITDLNKMYLAENKLDAKIMSRGVAWLDTGTFESFLDASLFIRTIQYRQGVKIACPEEIAYRLGYIDRQALAALASQLNQNSYGQYLQEILEDESFS